MQREYDISFYRYILYLKTAILDPWKSLKSPWILSFSLLWTPSIALYWHNVCVSVQVKLIWLCFSFSTLLLSLYQLPTRMWQRTKYSGTEVAYMSRNWNLRRRELLCESYWEDRWYTFIVLPVCRNTADNKRKIVIDYENWLYM